MVQTDRALDRIADEAERLAKAGATIGKAWTLAEICEHLALAMEGTRPASEPPAAEPLLKRVKQWVMKHAVLTRGRLPENAPSPDFVVPTGRLDNQAAINRLRRAIATFCAHLNQGSANWIPHPILGAMTGRQWRRFHIIHARHHFAVLKGSASSAAAR